MGHALVLFVIVGFAANCAAVDGWPEIAGYAPETDVSEQAAIDRDVKAIEECFSEKEWADCAREVYENGKYSHKSATEMRTIQGMSTAAEEKFSPLTEKEWATSASTSTHVPTGRNFAVARLFYEYHGDWSYADKFVQAALTSLGVWADVGDAARWSGPSGNTANVILARKQAVLKGTAYQAILLYALYEYFDKTWEAQWGDLPWNELLHGWDEGRAFWVGGLESGQGDGYLPYALAEKRAASFGTDDVVSPEFEGKSRVNFFALGAAHAGYLALDEYDSSPLSAQTVNSAYTCLEQMAFVAPLQGCLLYTYKASMCEYSNEDCGEDYGEVYAFCAAVLPLIAHVSRRDALVVSINADPTSDVAVPYGYKATREAIWSNLNEMGVRCSDIGSCDECGDSDDDAFWQQVEDEGWCQDDSAAALGACGLVSLGQRGDENIGSPVYKKSTAGDQPWKFTTILLLTIIGSCIVAALLTFGCAAWKHRKSARLTAAKQAKEAAVRSVEKPDEAGGEVSVTVTPEA